MGDDYEAEERARRREERRRKREAERKAASTNGIDTSYSTDLEEIRKRREERRRLKEAAAAETNGPTEETEEERARRERRERRARERAERDTADTETTYTPRRRRQREENNNESFSPKIEQTEQTQEEDTSSKQQEEEEQRQREEEERRRKEEEAERQRQKEEERRRREEEEAAAAAAQEEEKRRRREEEAAAADREDEERRQAEKKKKDADAPKAAEEAPAEEAKPKPKLGGKLGKLTAGRKKNIMAMMMKKAQTDLKEEAELKAQERNKYVDENVQPLNIDSLSRDRLRAMCEDLYEKLRSTEGVKFDLEVVIRKQDLEIEDMKVRANEARGKFERPELKKVQRNVDKPSEGEKKHVDFLSSLTSLKRQKAEEE